MSDVVSKETFVSNRKLTLEEAQTKAAEVTLLVQKRYPGSYVQTTDGTTYIIFGKDGTKIATISVESLQ